MFHHGFPYFINQYNPIITRYMSIVTQCDPIIFPQFIALLQRGCTRYNHIIT
jgi:hypothetical protein